MFLSFSIKRFEPILVLIEVSNSSISYGFMQPPNSILESSWRKMDRWAVSKLIMGPLHEAIETIWSSCMHAEGGKLMKGQVEGILYLCWLLSLTFAMSTKKSHLIWQHILAVPRQFLKGKVAMGYMRNMNRKKPWALNQIAILKTTLSYLCINAAGRNEKMRYDRFC